MEEKIPMLKSKSDPILTTTNDQNLYVHKWLWQQLPKVN